MKICIRSKYSNRMVNVVTHAKIKIFYTILLNKNKVNYGNSQDGSLLKIKFVSSEFPKICIALIKSNK